MKTSTKCILIFILLNINPIILIAQEDFNFDPSQNFFDIKAEKESYFQTQRQQIGDDAFFNEGSEYSRYQRWLKYWEPRLHPSGDFTIFRENQDYARQILNTNFPTISPGNSIASIVSPWTEVGPTSKPQFGITDIGNNGSARGIGPINFLQISEDNPNEMLCGTVKGGLFYSDDSGDSWHNSGSDTWWIHTDCSYGLFKPGDSNSWIAINSGNRSFENKIYRTTDHGQTWQVVSTFADIGITNDLNPKINLDYDLTHPDKMYLYSTSGLYVSGNIWSGTPSWSRVTDPLLNGIVHDIEIMKPNHIAPHTSNSNILFASVFKTNPNQWNAVLSLDAGLTWRNFSDAFFTSSPSFPLSLTGMSSGSLAIELTAANEKFIYFNLQNSSGAFEVLRCEFDIANNSFTWVSNLSPPTFDCYNCVPFANGHGFGISQTDAEEFYNGTFDRYSAFTDYIIPGSYSWYLSDESNSNRTQYHVDVEDFVTDPVNDGVVWMCNHGGVAKSTNFGRTWVDKSEGLGVADVWSMSTSITNPEYILMGLNHDGTLRSNGPYVQNNWMPSWRTVRGGDGTTALIDYSNPQFMWATAQFATDMRLSTNYGLETTNNTSSFIQAVSSSEARLNTDNAMIFYGVNGDKVMRSFGRGTSLLHPISNFGLPPYNLVQYKPIRIAVTEANADYLYTLVNWNSSGNWVNHLFRTTQARNPNSAAVINSWQVLTNPTNAWGNIIVDYANPEIVYFSQSSNSNPPAPGTQVIYKVDYSQSISSPVITDLTKNLPSVGLGPANIVLEKGTDGGMYLSTDVGVFYTNNKKINDPSVGWELYSDGLPHCPATGMEANYVANKIRIGLAARGVWENGFRCPDDLALSLPNGTNFDFYEAESSITSTDIILSGAKMKYRSGNEIILSHGFEALSGSDFDAFIHGCNTSGNSFRLANNSGNFIIEEEVDDNELEKDFMVYPNPNNGMMKVQFIKMPSTHNKLQVYDRIGKMIYSSASITDPNMELNLREFGKGIYLIRFSDSGKSSVVKVVVE